MNLFYGLAVIALYRQASVSQYQEKFLADPAIESFIQRISAYEDAGLEAMGAGFRHACRLAVKMRDGEVYRHERLVRRGGPEDAVGEDAIIRKFAANVREILPDAVAANLRAEVMQLDTVSDTRRLTSLLRA